MVRYTKAGVLDGEQNLALPPITENLVEVRRQALGWRGANGHGCIQHVALTAGTSSRPPSHGAPLPAAGTHGPSSPRTPPQPSQCELNDDDDYYYRSLQREQKQSFAQVIARLRIEMDMLGGGCRAKWGGSSLAWPSLHARISSLFYPVGAAVLHAWLSLAAVAGSPCSVS